MLDYSHHVGIARNSLFYLQWNLINPNILKPKPASSSSSKPKPASKVTNNKGVSKKQVKTGGKRKEETGDAF